MSLMPNSAENPRPQDDSALRLDADQTWACYQVLAQALMREPSLAQNPHFQVMRSEAYSSFCAAFERLQ